MLEAVGITNVGNVDGYIRGSVWNIFRISAVEGNHGVHDGDLVTITCEPQCEVRANKAHAPGDKNAFCLFHNPRNSPAMSRDLRLAKLGEVGEC